MPTSAQLRQDLAESEEAHRETLTDLKWVRLQLTSTQEAYAKAQADLAASQADLTRVERALHDADDAHDRIRDELTRAKEERSYARRAAKRFIDERDLARAELASAQQELSQLREGATELSFLYDSATAETARVRVLLDQVITENRTVRRQVERALTGRVDVARTDLVDPCGVCGWLIERGHAVERIPTTGVLRHVHCPDSPARPAPGSQEGEHQQ